MLIIAVLVLMLLLKKLGEYMAALLSITLHELGHLVLAHFCGCGINCVKATPVGLSISISDEGITGENAIKIYCAGPLVNLLLFAAAFSVNSIFNIRHKFIVLFAATNLFLALFNLIPAYPLDGGRILLKVLAGRLGLIGAGKLLRRLAAILSVIFVVLGVYQIYSTAFNFSLAVIGAYLIIIIRTGRMESALMNIKQIIYRRSRLIKKGIYPARDLVVIKSTLLGETLKSLDFDRFHIIYVLDENLKLQGAFTENEIVEAISEGHEKMTFEELVNKSVKSPQASTKM